MTNRHGLVCAALLLAACGKAQDGGGPGGRAATGPDVGLTRTPGVAMAYGYRFLVPARTLQALQERHAAACEALGPARCRVTAMTYHVDGQRRIEASLGLRLAPDLARRFGRQAVLATGEMGGMLIDAEATSEEAGTALAAARTEGRERGRERDAAVSDLARSGGSGAERAALRERAAASADAVRAARTAAAEAATKLAATPVELGYSSGTVDPGFADGPLTGALKDGWANIVAGVAVLLLVVVTVLPWLVAAFLLGLLWRRLLEPLVTRALARRTPPDEG